MRFGRNQKVILHLHALFSGGRRQSSFRTTAEKLRRRQPQRHIRHVDTETAPAPGTEGVVGCFGGVSDFEGILSRSGSEPT